MVFILQFLYTLVVADLQRLQLCTSTSSADSDMEYTVLFELYERYREAVQSEGSQAITISANTHQAYASLHSWGANFHNVFLEEANLGGMDFWSSKVFHQLGKAFSAAFSALIQDGTFLTDSLVYRKAFIKYLDLTEQIIHQRVQELEDADPVFNPNMVWPRFLALYSGAISSILIPVTVEDLILWYERVLSSHQSPLDEVCLLA